MFRLDRLVGILVAVLFAATLLHAQSPPPSPTQDVGKVWNSEVAQASAALGPVQYLAGAVDASAPTPGIPLTYSRVYGEPITSRYTLGSLGRGWTSNWAVRAEVDGHRVEHVAVD